MISDFHENIMNKTSSRKSENLSSLFSFQREISVRTENLLLFDFAFTYFLQRMSFLKMSLEIDHLYTVKFSKVYFDDSYFSHAELLLSFYQTIFRLRRFESVLHGESVIMKVKRWTVNVRCIFLKSYEFGALASRVFIINSVRKVSREIGNI